MSTRHPLHPALVHFPIACWSLAVLADVAGYWLGETAWRWSGGLLTIGGAMALLAICAGLLELPHVPEGAAMRVAYWHMGIMLLASCAFCARLLLRLDGLQPLAPDGLSLLLDAVGFGSLALGGWLGGSLVYHHGVGRSGD